MKLPLLVLTTVLWAACGGAPDPGPVLRPEYPWPALERSEWLNLNGVWAFQNDSENEGLTKNWPQDPPRFSGSIRVPFPWQGQDAAAPAVGWYRRTFVLPADWSAETTWLRTEGVGGEAQVWIDGKHAGSPPGGFHPSEFDVSNLLSSGNESEILIRVQDVPNSARSGLIGTVWLEGRPRTHISGLKFRAVPNGSSWALEARVSLRSPEASVDVSLSSSDPDVGEGRTSVTLAGGEGEALLSLPIMNAQLWRPESPRLYPLTIRATAPAGEADLVESTFGLRTIERDDRRILVDGRPEYFRGIALPQQTAKSDEELGATLEQIKSLGFNLLHAPSGAEPRVHYWADRLGLWTLGGDESYSGPSGLRGLDIEVSDTGSAFGNLPLLISVGPQPEPGLPQFFRDFTNRVRRMEFAQGYVWGAGIPDASAFRALVPEMTVADLQGPDYVGIGGDTSFEANPGDKLALFPFVSRYSPGDEPLRFQVALRSVNDLGGSVEFFSTPRQVTLGPGQVASLDEIVMSVPQSRSLSGTLAFELFDSSGRRVAANYAPLLVRDPSEEASPRSENFAPRRTALRATPGDRDDMQPVEFAYQLSPQLLAATPTQIEVLAELSAGPAGARDSVVGVTINGRSLGEVNLPDAPQGPAALLGNGLRYGYLLSLSLPLGPEDAASLRESRTLVLRFEPVRGGFAVFGEDSGRYVIDPTVIVVTEDVPGSAR